MSNTGNDRETWYAEAFWLADAAIKADAAGVGLAGLGREERHERG